MQGVRVIRVAAGEDGLAWAAALGDTGWEHGAAVLKDDPGAGVTVWRARLLGREVVVKRWALRTIKSRLEALVGWTRGVRHWRGAARLTAIGVRTAATVALVRGRAGGRLCEWLVMEYLPGKTVLQHLADRDLSVREEHALAGALGAQVARLQFRRAYNRDHKPSNLLVQWNSGVPEVAVLDCVAVRAPKSGADAAMFASLMIEPIGVGLPPRLALRRRAIEGWLSEWESPSGSSREIEWREAKMLWEFVESVVARHGDPTPRVDPLGRRDEAGG